MEDEDEDERDEGKSRAGKRRGEGRRRMREEKGCNGGDGKRKKQRKNQGKMTRSLFVYMCWVLASDLWKEGRKEGRETKGLCSVPVCRVSACLARVFSFLIPGPVFSLVCCLPLLFASLLARGGDGACCCYCCCSSVRCMHCSCKHKHYKCCSTRIPRTRWNCHSQPRLDLEGSLRALARFL